MKTPYTHYTNDELIYTINAFYNLKAYKPQQASAFNIDKKAFIGLLDELKIRTQENAIFIKESGE